MNIKLAVPMIHHKGPPSKVRLFRASPQKLRFGGRSSVILSIRYKLLFEHSILRYINYKILGYFV